MLITFVTKQATLMRKSTVLSLPILLVFPATTNPFVPTLNCWFRINNLGVINRKEVTQISFNLSFLFLFLFFLRLIFFILLFQLLFLFLFLFLFLSLSPPLYLVINFPMVSQPRPVASTDIWPTQSLPFADPTYSQ